MATKLSVILLGVAAMLVYSCDYKDNNPIGMPCESNEDCPGFDPDTCDLCCGCEMMCFQGKCGPASIDHKCCFVGDCNDKCQYPCDDHKDCDLAQRCEDNRCVECLMSQKMQCESSYSEDRCVEVYGRWTCSGGNCLCNCSTGNEGCGCRSDEECGGFCVMDPVEDSCSGIYMGRCYGYEIIEPGCYCIPGVSGEFVLECYE